MKVQGSSLELWKHNREVKTPDSLFCTFCISYVKNKQLFLLYSKDMKFLGGFDSNLLRGKMTGKLCNSQIYITFPL